MKVLIYILVLVGLIQEFIVKQHTPIQEAVEVVEVILEVADIQDMLFMNLQKR